MFGTLSVLYAFLIYDTFNLGWINWDIAPSEVKDLHFTSLYIFSVYDYDQLPNFSVTPSFEVKCMSMSTLALLGLTHTHVRKNR